MKAEYSLPPPSAAHSEVGLPGELVYVIQVASNDLCRVVSVQHSWPR